MQSSFRAALCAGVIFAAIFAPQISAQVNATATFTGQVTDQTGAAIVGATVKITSQDTGIVTTRQTSSDGNYTVPLLKSGSYSIEVTAQPSRTWPRKPDSSFST